MTKRVDVIGWVVSAAVSCTGCTTWSPQRNDDDAEFRNVDRAVLAFDECGPDDLQCQNCGVIGRFTQFGLDPTTCRPNESPVSCEVDWCQAIEEHVQTVTLISSSGEPTGLTLDERSYEEVFIASGDLQDGPPRLTALSRGHGYCDSGWGCGQPGDPTGECSFCSNDAGRTMQEYCSTAACDVDFDQLREDGFSGAWLFGHGVDVPPTDPALASEFSCANATSSPYLGELPVGDGTFAHTPPSESQDVALLEERSCWNPLGFGSSSQSTYEMPDGSTVTAAGPGLRVSTLWAGRPAFGNQTRTYTTRRPTTFERLAQGGLGDETEVVAGMDTRPQPCTNVRGTNRAQEIPYECIQGALSDLLASAEPVLGGPDHCVGDPVDLATGAFVDSHACTALPTPGPALTGGIWYDSRLARRSRGTNALGRGWLTSYSRRIVVDELPGADAITLYTESGEDVMFVETSEDSHEFVRPGQDPAEGYMVRNPEDFDHITLHYTDGSRDLYGRLGNLFRVYDPRGNELRIEIEWTPDEDGVPDSNDTFYWVLEDATTGMRIERVMTPRGTGSQTWWRIDEIREVRDDGTEPRVTTIEYDPNRRVPDAIIDPEGNRVDYDYHGYEFFPAASSAWGNPQIRRRCDENQSIADPTARCLETLYNGDNRVIEQLQPSGMRIAFERRGPSGYSQDDTNHDNPWNLSVTRMSLDGLEQTTQSYLFDERGRMSRVYAMDADLQAAVTAPHASYEYDEGSKKPTRVTDAEGRTVEMTYDSRGYLTSTTVAPGTSAAGTWIHTDHDSLGNPNTIVGPTGTIETFTRDATGRPLSRTLAGPGAQALTWSYEYWNGTDEPGSLRAITDPSGARTEFEYDERWRPRRTVVGVGGSAVESTVAHDFSGFVTAVVAENGVEATFTNDALGRPLSATVGGIQTAYEYDGLGHMLAMTEDVGGAAVRTEYEFEPVGEGYAVVRSLEPSGNPAVPRETLFEHDPFGRLTRMIEVGVQDNGGNRETTIVYDRDEQGRLVVRTSDPLGPLSEVSYDHTHRVMREISGNPAGAHRIVTYTRDAAGRVIEMEERGDGTSNDSAVRTTSYTYDAEGRLTSETLRGAQSVAHAMYYEYDGLGRLIATEDGAGRRTVMTHRYGNAAGGTGRTSVTRSVGGLVSTTTVYDEASRIREIRTGNLVETFEYTPSADAFPNRYDLAAYIDADGRRSEVRYDDRGLRTATIDPLGRTWAFEYDHAGRLTGVVRPGESEPWRRLEYDDAGRMVEMRDGSDLASIARTFAYRRDGSLRSRTDAAGNVVSYGYDARGRIVSLEHAANAGPEATYVYDALDRLTRVQDLHGRTDYAWDAVGRATGRTRVENGASRTLAYAYGGDGLLERITHPGGSTVQYTHDAAGMVVQVDAFGRPMDITYDAAGRLDRLTRDGFETRWLYDAAGRLERQYDTGEPSCEETTRLVWRGGSDLRLVTWTIDANTTGGAVLAAEGPADALPQPNGAWQVMTSGDFDGDGDRDLAWRNTGDGTVSIWLMSADGRSLQLARQLSSNPGLAWRLVGAGDFNADGHDDLVWRNEGSGQNSVWFMNGTARTGAVSLETVTGSVWSIDGVGDLDGDGDADLVWRNGSNAQVSVWAMDGTERVGSGRLTAPNGSWASVQRSWSIEDVADSDGDGLDEVWWRNPTNGQVTGWRVDVEAFAYATFAISSSNGLPDSAWDLVAVLPAGSPCERGNDRRYVRNGSGDIVEVQRDGALEARYDYDMLRRLIAVTTPAGTHTYGYDAFGNWTTFDGEEAYGVDELGQFETHDARGNLVADAELDYEYNALGQLVRTAAKDGSLAVVYRYDGLGNLVGYTQTGASTRLDIDERGALAVVVGANRDGEEHRFAHGPGGLMAEQRNGAFIAQRWDHRGSIEGSLGAGLPAFDYDPWGVGSTAPRGRPGLRGEWHNPDGTVFMRARTYHPGHHRFLQRDPFVGFTGRPQSMTPYAYAENNPVNWADPTGLYTQFTDGHGRSVDAGSVHPDTSRLSPNGDFTVHARVLNQFVNAPLDVMPYLGLGPQAAMARWAMNNPRDAAIVGVSMIPWVGEGMDVWDIFRSFVNDSGCVKWGRAGLAAGSLGVSALTATLLPNAAALRRTDLADATLGSRFGPQTAFGAARDCVACSLALHYRTTPAEIMKMDPRFIPGPKGVNPAALDRAFIDAGLEPHTDYTDLPMFGYSVMERYRRGEIADGTGFVVANQGHAIYYRLDNGRLRAFDGQRGTAGAGSIDNVTKTKVWTLPPIP